MTDTFRGYPIYRDAEGRTRFTDTDELTTETWYSRPCGCCGEFGNSNDGKPDPCLGQLPGVDNACCGHGDRDEAYIRFTNGVIIRGFIVDRKKQQ